jgi:hypothetical protein
LVRLWLVEAYGSAAQESQTEARQKHAPSGDRCGRRPASLQGPGGGRQLSVYRFIFRFYEPVLRVHELAGFQQCRRPGSSYATQAVGLTRISPCR